MTWVSFIFKHNRKSLTETFKPILEGFREFFVIVDEYLVK